MNNEITESGAKEAISFKESTQTGSGVIIALRNTSAGKVI